MLSTCVRNCQVMSSIAAVGGATHCLQKETTLDGLPGKPSWGVMLIPRLTPSRVHTIEALQVQDCGHGRDADRCVRLPSDLP